MIQIFFVFIALCSCEVHAFFSYDTASSLMEQGRWQEAKQQLQKLLIDEPDAPDVLYDAGVASYKTKDYKQARAYFNRATQLPLTKISLKEQSHFNAGNAAAALKDYGDAIKHYEMVLDINASNEKAKHNLEKIKELMQQKQEQQKNDESKESSDDKDQKDQSSDDAQKNMDNEKKKRNEDKSRQDTKDQNKSQSPQDRQQQQKEDPKQQGADADQSNSGKDSQENQGEQKDTRKQEQENHETPSDQQKGTQNHIQSNGAPEKDQGQEGQAGDAASGNQNNLQEKLDERLIRVLDAQEKKDAALNKRMINIAVGQSMGGAQGENCW